MNREMRGISHGITVLVVVAIVIVLGTGAYVASSIQPSSNFSTTQSSNSTTITTTYYWNSASTSAPSGFRLELSIAPSNGTFGEAINVNEYNALSTVSNVTLENNWSYPEASLNPNSPCPLNGPIGFAVFQGYYDMSNFTKASALKLFNTTHGYLCTAFTSSGNTYYSFEPQSDQASLIFQGETASWTPTTSLTFLAKGYWYGDYPEGNTSFRSFSQGNYTVLAADEWGKVVLLHFTVYGNGISVGTSTFVTSTISGNHSTHSVTSTPATNYDYGGIANLTLYSSQVLPYINHAYSYQLSIYPSQFGHGLLYAIINVNESLNVEGNYTTGYKLTWAGVLVLNATIQYTAPDSYSIMAFGVSNLSDQVQNLTFTQTEQHVIQVALANTTVKQMMNNSQYYVEYITPAPVSNGTFNNDYFVLFFQGNGTRIVGVYVNQEVSAAVNAYIDTRAYTMCFGSENVCFTSPWNST